MKPWVAPLIIMWAVAATGVAIMLGLRAPEAPLPAPDTTEVDRVEAYAERTTRRLKERVERLRAALAGVVVTEPLPEPAGGLAAPTRATQLLDLLDRSRRLSEGDGWTMQASQALDRQMYALLAGDTSTHIALMQRLRTAASEDEAHEVLSLLVHNPFTALTSSRDVRVAIHESAREMASDALPHRRAAAIEALYGYDATSLEEVLFGIARLGEERDAVVREVLLAELSVAALGHGLTVEQAKPLLEGLRQRCGERGGAWAGGALAEWSSDSGDFTRISVLLQGANESRDNNAAQYYLNAFRRDTRLAGAFEKGARDRLTGVMQDTDVPDTVRELAASFLRGYAPWDDKTAAAVASFRGE